MDEKNLKEIAGSVFERYKEVNKVYVTSDSQVFFDEVHAKNHAAPKKGRKELDVKIVMRPEEDAAKETAKDLIERIVFMTTADDVNEALDAEIAGMHRKSVIDAATKKIELLKS